MSHKHSSIDKDITFKMCELQPLNYLTKKKIITT